MAPCEEPKSDLDFFKFSSTFQAAFFLEIQSNGGHIANTVQILNITYLYVSRFTFFLKIRYFLLNNRRHYWEVGIIDT